MKKFATLQFLIFGLIILGFGQWPSDPTENLAISSESGEQAIPKVATSESGITYIAWFSNTSGNYDVMLQKLDVFGNTLWEDNGIVVSDNPAMSWLTDWDMTVDQTDHAILTFQDIRNGNNDIFAYRISPDGEFVWGEDGIELSTGPAFDVSPKVCVTNANNVCFAWQAEDVVILQKISPDGNKLWGDSGITLSGDNTFSWPQLIAVGEDEVILKYFEDTGNFPAITRKAYAQRFDVDGNPVWANDAIISNAGGITAWTQVLPFINDGNDGFFIAWHDDRDNNMLASVFVQHINANGEILLGDNGTEASTMMGRNNFYAHLALPTGSDDIYVFWNEMDGDQNNRGIYGQKISAAGERVWTDNGKSIIEISSMNVFPISASQSETDLIVFYEEYFDVVDAKVKAMCLDTDGEFVWTEEKIDLCSLPSAKVHSVVGNFNSDQWISAWEDDRNGNTDIYAQNIQLDGTLGPVVIQGEVEVFPDTLFFEENPQILPCKIINNTLEPYTITELDEIGMYFWWILDPVPSVPYDILPGDSLIFEVQFEVLTDGYEIDYLNIISEVDTHIVVIAINEDLFVNISQQKDEASLIHTFPNPSNSYITIKFTSLIFNNATLNISDQTGKIIRTYNLDGKSSFTWDGKNETHQKVKPGTYFYQFISDEILETGKLIIIE